MIFQRRTIAPPSSGKRIWKGRQDLTDLTPFLRAIYPSPYAQQGSVGRLAYTRLLECAELEIAAAGNGHPGLCCGTRETTKRIERGLVASSLRWT
jgi:hypothetical protein